jgi:hypothetical protein
VSPHMKWSTMTMATITVGTRMIIMTTGEITVSH